jgi:hypothetical protein
MLGSSPVAAQLAASQEGLSSMSESEYTKLHKYLIKLSCLINQVIRFEWSLNYRMNILINCTSVNMIDVNVTVRLLLPTDHVYKSPCIKSVSTLLGNPNK